MDEIISYIKQREARGKELREASENKDQTLAEHEQVVKDLIDFRMEKPKYSLDCENVREQLVKAALEHPGKDGLIPIFYGFAMSSVASNNHCRATASGLAYHEDLGLIDSHCLGYEVDPELLKCPALDQEQQFIYNFRQDLSIGHFNTEFDRKLLTTLFSKANDDEYWHDIYALS